MYSDTNLSQSLERAEASCSAAFVQSRARLFPKSYAEWLEVSGAYALFDGVDSPLTQTFGLGLFVKITPEDLDKIEAFFLKRGAPIFHEVSPLADPLHLELLFMRGYQPIEMTSVMYRSLVGKSGDEVRGNSEISTRIVTEGEEDIWARTSAEGWSTEIPGLSDFMYQFGQIVSHSKNVKPFIAELDGKAISTGTLFINGEVALLAGASTIPSGRKKGAQNMLLEARLQYAVSQGCTIAMMCASPGSQSQRNAEKNGFRIAYTRTKWKYIGSQ